MTLETILSCYQSYLEACRTYIVTDLAKASDTIVLTEYFHGGKMFRALFALVSASAIGVELNSITSVAAALELMHGASLIHDDIVDETKTRRGRPALHIQMGIGPAIILGDYLILRAITVLGESRSVFGLEKTREASHALNSYAQACCLGEIRELLSTRENTDDEYLRIAKGKTASQFAAAVTLPAILGGGTSEEIDALRTYGLNVGIAFQIRDDIQDIDDDAAINGRLSWPLLYLQRHGSSTAPQHSRHLLPAVAGRPGRVAAFLKDEGIVDCLKTMRDQHVSAGLQALEQLRPSDGRAHLALLASYAVYRCA